MGQATAVPRTGAPWPAIRRLAKVAMLGAGLTAATAATASGVLIGQARQARRTIPLAEAPPPRGDGLYGAKFSGAPLTLVVLGDSSAAGYGVHRPRETPGALLATGISRRLRRPVRLYRLAVVGSLSAGLSPQVEAALEHRPDLAVILIGGNDVTNRTPHPVAVRHLVNAVRALRSAGAEVVVGTCPDLGAIQPIKPPLRWLARRWSRQLAAAQTVAVVEAGGWTVSLGDLLGPRFAAEPTRMFAWDHFHPSAEGYAIAAAALLPTALSALGTAARPAEASGHEHPATPGDGLRPTVTFGAAGVRSLPEAAQLAARHAGTEVSAAQVGGHDRGPAGRWARMRRRRPWFGHAREPVPDQPPGPTPVPDQPPGPPTGATASTVEESAT